MTLTNEQVAELRAALKAEMHPDSSSGEFHALKRLLYAHAPALIEIAADRDALTAERDHWKANHDNQVRVKQSILDRPDLQDRAKKVQDIIAERDRYRVALELLATRLETDARASIAEASRIRSAVKTNTDAEERCMLRANLWRDCAMHIRNAVNEPTPPAEGGRV